MSDKNRPLEMIDYWQFTTEEKNELIKRLTSVLLVLRTSIKATQDELARAAGISRQTYNAIEMKKRLMTWNTYLSLIFVFDYTPASHYIIRELGVFPVRLDECWVNGKTELNSEE